mgnify:CR=1 FL=1
MPVVPAARESSLSGGRTTAFVSLRHPRGGRPAGEGGLDGVSGKVCGYSPPPARRQRSLCAPAVAHVLGGRSAVRPAKTWAGLTGRSGGAPCNEFANRRNQIPGYFHYCPRIIFVRGFVLCNSFFFRLRFVALKYALDSLLIPAGRKDFLLHRFPLFRNLRLYAVSGLPQSS